MSIDFYEERRWKKSACYIMGNYIAKQHEKNERNKKIDNLYKECLYIYDSMKANTRVSDITPLSDPKGANEEVNVCFR